MGIRGPARAVNRQCRIGDKKIRMSLLENLQRRRRCSVFYENADFWSIFWLTEQCSIGVEANNELFRSITWVGFVSSRF